MAEESSVAADKLRLVLVSAEAELLDQLCDEVTLPGRAGEIGVLPGHAAYIGTLAPGVVTYRTGSTSERVAISGGFCEVFDGGVRVLVDSAVEAESVDREAVESELGDARQAADGADAEDLVAAQDRVRELEAKLDLVN